jgi:hypothetical protein
MSELVHDMRAVCILAVRHPREAEAMASVLQVISAIERIGNAAVDIARIVTHRLGIPRELVADLSDAEEVSHRVLVREGSHMATAPRRPGAAGADRHAGHGHPPGPRVDHRGRRRRHAAPRATCCSCEGPRRASPACGSWPPHPYWEPPVPPEDGASPTSTAPWTCSSR